jgi:hypothetical protein
MLDVSFENTNKLKQLILENPDCPLLIFAGEDAWSDNFPYELAEAREPYVTEIAEYGNYFLEKDDYADRLSDDMAGKDDFNWMPDAEFEKAVDSALAKVEFTKCIIIHVG